MKELDIMKVVYVVSLAHKWDIIGVFDDVEKMVNATIEGLESGEYWDIVVEWYCEDNNIDYYAVYDDEDFDYDAFDDAVREYAKINLKRDNTFLDEYHYIEKSYLNNETT